MIEHVKNGFTYTPIPAQTSNAALLGTGRVLPIAIFLAARGSPFSINGSLKTFTQRTAPTPRRITVIKIPLIPKRHWFERANSFASAHNNNSSHATLLIVDHQFLNNYPGNTENCVTTGYREECSLT